MRGRLFKGINGPLRFLQKFGDGAVGIDGVEHELVDDLGQLCPVGEAWQFEGIFVKGFEHVVERDSGVDFRVSPCRHATTDAAFEGEQFVLVGRRAVAKECVGNVAVWAA